MTEALKILTLRDALTLKQKAMGARLKSEKKKQVDKLNDMKPLQFAIITSDGIDKGHIVFRPSEMTSLFAVDLTDGTQWSRRTEVGEREVRILEAGSTLIIE